MHKSMLSVSALLAVVCLLACGSDPTQEEVCGACTDASFKAVCEAGYELCAETDNCSLGDYKDTFDKSGVCK